MVIAREADSTTARSIRRLEAEIDSLRRKIQSMEEQSGGGRRRGRGRGLASADDLVALMEEDDENVERANMNRRSRRNRVEALLEAITRRPGQLRFNGGSTTILQYGHGGGDGHTMGAGSFDIYAHTAFGPHSLLFFDLEAVGGDGPDEFYSTMAGLNDDAGSTQDEDGVDRLTVLEAWSEFTMCDRIFTITAGKIDLTNYFDNNASANDETTQFISSAFVNSAAFAVPENAPGVRFRTTLANRLHFQVGLSSADNSGKDLFEEIYRIAGIGIAFLPDSDFESNFRVYGYQHPSAEGAYGYGVSLDHVSFGAFNLFARYGRNQDDLADFWRIESSWSAGTRLVREIAGKTVVLGLAAGENIPADHDLNNERIMEIYSRCRLNKWACLSPHLQMVWNAGGGSERIALFGLRTNFNF
ncbi:MAG: hypothetical protein ACQERI_00265 [Candidatus Krumholzibacteriota bacterium]